MANEREPLRVSPKGFSFVLNITPYYPQISDKMRAVPGTVARGILF